MDNVTRNLPENLEEERRRLALEIGRNLAMDEYLLALQWTEMLLSLEIRKRYPDLFGAVAEVGLRAFVSGVTLSLAMVKNYAEFLRSLCR